ncbi:MAG: nuclear transport factor 2 family protein [Geminicoccaceae bacterium]|nr:nuclear transport factor 2 family protein [Geminicoccaceae bacterium]
MTSPPVPACLLRYMDGLKSRDVATIATTVAEDLAFVSPARTIGKTAFLHFLRALYSGFPDWSYQHDPLETRGEGRFAIRWRQGGTHTGFLVLPGWPEVAPTGRRVDIPPHHFFYRVEDELIVMIRPDPVPGAAPRGIFEQLGIEPPL